MKNFSRKEITVGVIVLVVFIASYIGIILYADQEPFLNGVEVKTTAPASPDHVVINVKTMSIDPVKGETVVRFQFEPQGALLSPDGVSWIVEQAPTEVWLKAVSWDGLRLLAVGSMGRILRSDCAQPKTPRIRRRLFRGQA